MVDKKQIKRIEDMEILLDRANLAIDNLNLALDKYIEAKTDIETIINYAESDYFMKDLEADEMGLLPKDLKRGILSEDGISDILDKNMELLDRIDDIQE